MYEVLIVAKGYPLLRSGWKELTENQTWDVGALRLQRGGFLQVELEDAEGLVKNTSFSIRDAAGRPRASIRIRGGITERSNPIPPGTYYLQVADKNCLCARHKFEIHAGRDTDLKVKVQRGIPVSLEFVVKTDEGIVRPSGWITVEIKNAAGQVILTRAAWWRSAYELVRILDFAARPGKYRITASTQTGERGEAALTVGDKAAAPKRIVLR